jgi:protein-disulfide isomerase
MRTLISIFIFSACGTTAPASPTSSPKAPAATEAASVVGTWSGGEISNTDLDDSIRIELIKLEADFVTGAHEARANGLDALIGEKVLEAEAAKRSMADIEALLTAEVNDKVVPPTDGEIATFYKVMARQMGGRTLDEVRPAIIGEITRRATAERFEAYMGELRKTYKVNLSLPRPEMPRIPISADDDPFIGPVDAPVTIVQFAEFQCPYCGKAKEIIDQVMEKYPNQIKMVHRDFPLSFHDRAIPAAVAANCAGEQEQYWPMYDVLMSNQRALSETDLSGYATKLGLDMDKWNTCRKDPAQEQEVQADFEDGTKAGVQGTPAFFINGIFLNGAVPLEKFTAIIDAELAG